MKLLDALEAAGIPTDGLKTIAFDGVNTVTLTYADIPDRVPRGREHAHPRQFVAALEPRRAPGEVTPPVDQAPADEHLVLVPSIREADHGPAGLQVGTDPADVLLGDVELQDLTPADEHQVERPIGHDRPPSAGDSPTG